MSASLAAMYDPPTEPLKPGSRLSSLTVMSLGFKVTDALLSKLVVNEPSKTMFCAPTAPVARNVHVPEMTAAADGAENDPRQAVNARAATREQQPIMFLS